MSVTVCSVSVLMDIQFVFSYYTPAFVCNSRHSLITMITSLLVHSVQLLLVTLFVFLYKFFLFSHSFSVLVSVLLSDCLFAGNTIKSVF